MATTRKPAASKSTKNAVIDKEKEKRTAEAIAHDKRRRNIWSIVLFAIGILFIAFSFIGNASAEAPSAWDAIHSFVCGIFGVSVFFIGPIIIYVAIMISLDKDKSTVRAKLLQLIFFVLLFSAAIQIIFIGKVGNEGTEGFFGIVADEYLAGTNLSGGGVCGMILAMPLLLFTRVGASIIILLIIFVVVMLIANVSLMDFLGFIAKPFKKAHEKVKEKRELYEEDVLIVRQEKEKEEQEKLLNQKLLEELQEEEKRSQKFSSIEAVTTGARDAAVSDEENDVNLVAEQEKDMNLFKKKLEEISNPEQLTTETVEISEPEKENHDDNPVSEAIEEYKKENEKQDETITVDTVISTDADGQQFFEDIVATASSYTLPPIILLNDIVNDMSKMQNIDNEIHNNSEILVSALKSFGVETKFLQAVRGPSVTRYELQPAPGVKIAKITGLVDDIALNLATAGVRIEAPIPNKAAVGIEVPNKEKETVSIREMIDSDSFRKTESKLGAVLGKNISGDIVICDISEMPHILIAGTTGSGKSVCVNSIIMSILFRSTPDEVRLLMIDPKAVEFMIYNGIPHLLIPVVTDPKKAAGALGWAVSEMDNRYRLLGENNVRDINSYNKLAKKRDDLTYMPHVVIFIDELADLMMTSKNDVESSICRLAQKARAAGMHLVVATQRPSVDVITGLIKSNIPSRISLKVASQIDSRTIIDNAGAEKLLGKGDMLYKSVGMAKPMRVQGCWVSDKEVERVTDFIKKSFVLSYDETVIEEVERQAEKVGGDDKNRDFGGEIDASDDKLEEAIEIVLDAGRASTSALQMRLQVGYGRAARMIDTMEKMGIVGPSEGTKPRQILMTKQDWYERQLNKNE